MDQSKPTQGLDDAVICRHLHRANSVALQAVAEGKHPFGAILVGADNDTVLMEQGNVDTLRHAEVELARRAASEFTAEFLWDCTLYTTVEPCVMCAGALYWANIGRVVYGMTEAQLLAYTGNHEENPTMDLPCRDVFKCGQKAVQVLGPIDALATDIAAVHANFWGAR